MDYVKQPIENLIKRIESLEQRLLRVEILLQIQPTDIVPCDYQEPYITSSK